jgi:anti-sigma B factor antagonist
MTIISLAIRADVPVVVIDDERLRDDRSLQELYHEIVSQLEEGGKKNLLLDFELVRGITSAGLNMMIRIKNKCDEKGTSLHLCHLQPMVAEVFQKTRLRTLFRIHDTIGAGLSTIQEPM